MSEPGDENESVELTRLEAWSGYDLISQTIDVESKAEWDRKSSLEQRAINIITSSGVLVTLAFGFTTLIQRGNNFQSLVGHDRWMLAVSVSLFVAAALVALFINFPLRYSQLRVTRLRRMLYLPLPHDKATPAGGQPPPSVQPSDTARDPAGGQPSPGGQPDDSAGEERINSKLLEERLRAFLGNGQRAPTPVDVAVRRTVLRYELDRGFIQVLADARSLNRTKAIALFVSMALEVVAIGFLAAAVVYVVSNINLATGQGTAATKATVSVSSKSLGFPVSGAAPVGLGLASPVQQVTITNTGKVPVQMGYGSPSGADPTISSTYPNGFTIIGNSCAGNTIPAGTACTFSVDFTPTTLNDETGTLTVYDNAAGGRQTISLTGQGTAAQARLSSTKLTFSSSWVGKASSPQKITVTNTGTVPQQMGYWNPSKSNPSVSASYASDFSILSNGCADNTIPVGTTCTFEVEFTPSTSNTETGMLLIYGNTADNPQEIPVQGCISSSNA